MGHSLINVMRGGGGGGGGGPTLRFLHLRVVQQLKGCLEWTQNLIFDILEQTQYLMLIAFELKNEIIVSYWMEKKN